MSGARGFSIAIRPLPIDARGGQVDQMQRRIRRRSRRHRKDDALAEAGGLAVAHERGAVGQKDTQQHHIVGGRGRSAMSEEHESRQRAR
jgi:hypothetical protein